MKTRKQLVKAQKALFDLLIGDKTEEKALGKKESLQVEATLRTIGWVLKDSSRLEKLLLKCEDSDEPI